MDDMKIFVPITKIDAAQRLVYGVVTAEKPDVSGEVCDYASTKPLYQKWSQNFASATDGKSLGNLRAMHGHVAAGKLVEIAFNDEAKRIEICGKVVDDAEWQKVEEGVYTGFSQGGRYLKRWPDPDAAGFDALHSRAVGSFTGRSSVSAGSDLCGDQGGRLDRAAQVQGRRSSRASADCSSPKSARGIPGPTKSASNRSHDLLVELDPDCCAGGAHPRRAMLMRSRNFRRRPGRRGR